MNIKVMTFNIHHGKGMDKKADLGRIAEVISVCGADIIGLNEVDSYYSKRSLFEDQAAWLANELKMDYAFSPAISKKPKHLPEKRKFGNALLSRYPIIEKKTHSFHIPGMSEGRSMLEAIVQINTQYLQIAVTHMSLNPLLHRKQIDVLIRQLQANAYPAILMGDFNMKPGSKGWGKLTETFQDVWAEAGTGPGHTYPSLRPRSRLDYIFATRDFQVVDAKVEKDMANASDHLPLAATLRYPEKE